MKRTSPETPVLFTVFNRPACTRRVFEAIRRAAPRRLFIACDGPRPERPEEAPLVSQVRGIVAEVDWECEVATLFQNPDRQICKDTVLDEVAFGLELAGIDRAEALRRAQLVIDRFGLPADEAPFSLSRGQRQMVALASVVVVEPKIVVLDEPTSGLDYRECMTVMETVRTMAERGCAVIMVCHDMEVVSAFAERIVVMADGRILEEGTPQQIFDSPKDPRLQDFLSKVL